MHCCIDYQSMHEESAEEIEKNNEQTWKKVHEEERTRWQLSEENEHEVDDIIWKSSCLQCQYIIIIIINLYILVTSIKSTHERLYAICIEWTKLFEVENHSQSTWLLHAVETVSFETMYQICSRWLHVREWVF